MTKEARLERRLFCVVLAAGGSERLGRPKQLLRRPVRPLLLDAVHAATAVAPGRVLVVLGSDALRLRSMLARHARGIRIAKNTRWREGMGRSLSVALEALPPECSAALVTLCDQPEVDELALERLIAAWRRRPRLAAAAVYDGRRGVPAVLPRHMWRDIGSGDRGARDALRKATAVSGVGLSEAAIDVDTPEDAARLAAAPRRRLKMRRLPRGRAWHS